MNQPPALRPPNVYGTVSFMDLRTNRGDQPPRSRPGVLDRLACSAGPRGEGREVAICRAVVELLNETSYEAITMDAVAARAGASKATIYRRWSNKNDLVIAALQRFFDSRDQFLPNTGRLRDDMVEWIGLQSSNSESVAGNTAALKSLLHAAGADAELAHSIRNSLRQSQLGGWQILLDRAHERGEVRRPVAASLIWEVAQAQFCSRVGVDTGAVDPSYTRHLVDDVLMPVIMHAGSASLPVI